MANSAVFKKKVQCTVVSDLLNKLCITAVLTEKQAEALSEIYLSSKIMLLSTTIRNIAEQHMN